MAGLARRLGWCVAGYAALAWLPLVASEYHTHVFTIALYYVIVAVGWNLLAGYAGQFSLAQHTFAGIGAYGCREIAESYQDCRERLAYFVVQLS